MSIYNIHMSAWRKTVGVLLRDIINSEYYSEQMTL